jgi:hypothetical protein
MITALLSNLAMEPTGLSVADPAKQYCAGGSSPGR